MTDAKTEIRPAHYWVTTDDGTLVREGYIPVTSDGIIDTAGCLRGLPIGDYRFRIAWDEAAD